MSTKILGNDIRVKHVLEIKKKLFSVLEREHVKPGKGGAFVNVKMRCLEDGSKSDRRFRSDEVVLRAHIEEENFQYLFHDNKEVTLMNTSDYSQFVVEVSVFDEKIKFLQDEMQITLQKHQERVIDVILPDTVKAAIEETEPCIKGQTAAASYKPAILNKGLLRVMVPPFIKVGDEILVKTEDCTYNSRVE